MPPPAPSSSCQPAGDDERMCQSVPYACRLAAAGLETETGRSTDRQLLPPRLQPCFFTAPRVVETRTHLRGCLHYMRTCAAAVWCSRACVYTGSGPSGVVSAPPAHAFVLAASSRFRTSVCSRTRYCTLRRAVGTVVFSTSGSRFSRLAVLLTVLLLVVFFSPSRVVDCCFTSGCVFLA